MNALRLSAQRALLDAVFPKLRAVFISADEKAWRVRFVVDGDISDNERDTLTTAGAEIAADMSHDFAYDEIIERVDAPARVVAPAGWMAVFARSEQHP